MGDKGLTANETTSAAVTVKLAEPLTAPTAAVTVLVPTAAAVAKPAELTVTVLVFEEVQSAVELTSTVAPSVSVAVATNERDSPLGNETTAGVTAINTGAGSTTVMAVLPEMEPTVARTVLVPTLTAVAKPELSMVTKLGVKEDQVALDVTSTVDASVLVAVAVNARVDPLGTATLAGVTAMD